MASTPQTQGAQSIRRALAILNVLAIGRDSGMRLSEVCRSTGLSRPTVHRILRVLAEEGLVEHRLNTRRYAIGDQVSILALARNARSPLLRVSEPYLREAALKLGDAVFLTVRTGLDSVCIARQLGNVPTGVWMAEVGARRPLGVSNAGVAMLSLLADDEVDEILVRNRDRLRAYGIREAALRSLVHEAKMQGYVVQPQGLVRGTKVVSVGLPVSRHSPLAALTVVGIDRRMTSQRLSEIREALQTHAHDLVLAIIQSGKTGRHTSPFSSRAIERTK
jgi:DNA-binding IclR family transcriptional regulator